MPVDVLHETISKGKGQINVDCEKDYFSIYAGEFEETWPADFSIYELLFRWHFWLWDQQLFATGDIIEITD